MRTTALLLAFAAAGPFQPIMAQWIMATSKLDVAPDVHSVYSDSRFVYIESAGLSLHSFGRLEANQYDAPLGPRKLTFRVPRFPRPAGKPMNTPLGIVGVFVTGVPIYNPIGAASYGDRNIWHQDAVAVSRLGTATGYPAIVGFALDGYPIVGASGLRSGYRLRAMTKRTQLPDGTMLTPGQEGPDVGPEYPLGSFAEDYEYVAGSGDLDEFNGRSIGDSYAYFVTDTWPYTMGPRYRGEPSLDMPRRVSVVHGNGVDLWTDRLQIEANSPLQLTLDFHKRFLETVHERPVHLVVVSKDLAWFDHIHPLPVPGDGLSVSYSFPSAGDYWIYADYTAPGAAPAVARFSLHVSGDLRRPELRVAPAVRFEAPEHIEANRDLLFSFSMPFGDYEPWLGAWAHIMIVGRDGENFIHAHPLEDAAVVHNHTDPVAGPAPAAIRTQIGFNSAGEYRLWFQFSRHGEVFTVPFDVTVAPGNGPAKAPVPPGFTVGSAGFSPDRIVVPAGKPAHLAFTRVDAQNCARELVFPDLGIRKALPLGKTVFVDLPARAAGELHFACGMGMYKGAIVIK